MLKRLEAGYEPIDVSIEKWKDIKYNDEIKTVYKSDEPEPESTKERKIDE